MGQKQSTMGGNKKPVRDSAAAAAPAHEPSNDAASKVKQSESAGGKPSHSRLFNLMPGDVMAVINSFLDTKDLMRSTATCRFFTTSVSTDLSTAQVTRLLARVVRGEQVEAEALLIKNPKLLLLNTGRGADYSGRIVVGQTAWQAALCAGDVEMLQMIEPYFDSIAVTKKDKNNTPIRITGREIRERQTAEIFPKGFDAHVAQQESSTFNFDAIVAAIGEANDDQLKSAINLEGAILPVTDASPIMTNAGAVNELTKALNAFRQAFTAQSLNEQVFNPQHLQRALEIYTAQYDGWNYKKCQVFWSQVVGFAQRFMPACYAQAFAQGLYYLTKESNPEVLKRSLSFTVGGGRIFSDGANFFGLGFKFGAGLWCARDAPLGAEHVVGGVDWSRESFKKLCQTKTVYLRTYARTCAADPASTSSMLGR